MVIVDVAIHLIYDLQYVKSLFCSKQVIINEIASAKYYSFSIDSTPDISHTDQLTFRVHEDGTKRFLKFEEIHSHTGLNLFNTISS